MSHDEIRQRLAAIEHIDWSTVERQPSRDEPICSDQIAVGPVTLFAVDPDDPPIERVMERAIIAFLRHATADMRRLLADLDHATTTREAIMPTHPNAIYGPPPDPERGQPATFLSDVVEVLRPNGDVVRMDLVALADAAINADRAVTGLREDNEALRREVAVLRDKVSRIERAGRILAGEGDEWGDR